MFCGQGPNTTGESRIRFQVEKVSKYGHEQSLLFVSLLVHLRSRSGIYFSTPSIRDGTWLLLDSSCIFFVIQVSILNQSLWEGVLTKS